MTNKNVIRLTLDTCRGFHKVMEVMGITLCPVCNKETRDAKTIPILPLHSASNQSRRAGNGKD